VIRRAEMLAEITRMSFSIGISGTHGKTTSTSMTGLVLEAAGLDPTIIVGGKVKNYGSNNVMGSGKFIVVEADEYDHSFLSLTPCIAGITNIDTDHLDCYRNLDDIKGAFVEYANKVPFFGICYGLQCAVIEFARNVCGIPEATSSEWYQENETVDLSKAFVALMDAQRKVTAKGGTMRLGEYACGLKPGTQARTAYQAEIIRERHRHRFEVNPVKVKILEKNGLIVSGSNPDSRLVEIMELADHPWFLGTQAHPEFRSRPVDAHPLFRAFIQAALEFQNQKKKG
jgi:gamma-glutamyl-gamma-aminobutyrate hydrolase PuuD